MEHQEKSKLHKLLGDHVLGKSGQVSVDSLADNEVVGLYFSAHWCGPCRQFTPALGEAYIDLRSKGKKFEVIFISADQDEKSYQDYYSEMMWLSVPFDRKALIKLSKAFDVKGYPTLILLNGQGELITKNGRQAVSDIEGFPWPQPTVLDTLGKQFLSHDVPAAEDPKTDEYIATFKDMGFDEEQSRYALKAASNDNEAAMEYLLTGIPDSVIDSPALPGIVGGKEVLQGKFVGLYFSASWCPPCGMFTPKLITCYNKLKEKRQDFEFIFVSMDRDKKSFLSYYQKMPFLGLDFDKHKERKSLGEMLEVSGIPCLVILDAEGKVVTSKGVQAVSNDPEGENFPWPPEPPKLVNDINSPEINGLLKLPTIIVFAEGQDKSELERLEGLLLIVAEAEKEKAKATGEEEGAFSFCISKKDSNASQQLRNLVGLAPLPSGGEEKKVVCDGDVCQIVKGGAGAEAGSESIILLDIRDGGYYAVDGPLSVEGLEIFFEVFRAGALDKIPLRE